MPQKRNPSALENLRGISRRVVGDSQTVFLLAPNTSTGMSDYRGPQQVLDTAEGARQMYELFGQIVESLVVNPARALQEVDDDYATMTEVADTLRKVADVPFRIGHHFASEMTTYGRARGKRPKDLTWDELRNIYTESTHGLSCGGWIWGRTITSPSRSISTSCSRAFERCCGATAGQKSNS